MPTKEKKLVILGLLGSTLDSGSSADRWKRWRPTVDLCRHGDDLPIARFELLAAPRFDSLTRQVKADMEEVSSRTTVRVHALDFQDPWDFQEVYAALHDFARQYKFVPEDEEYFIHITTGTHVAQICLFLLTEAHYLPAKLIQTAPPAGKTTVVDNAVQVQTKGDRRSPLGRFSVIDLDLSKYDSIASRFRQEKKESVSFLKSGIETRNSAFNQLIERIERVAIASKAPMLLMGPTGSGKSLLARRIYELKKSRRQLAEVNGPFVELNCATLRGDAAMSALFGHIKGAYTGAVGQRPGLLLTADGGVLFLDEIGELKADEQAMLLRALEEKRFFPVGSDLEVTSNFQLIAGTNRDLAREVHDGAFREDLFARINLWTFSLPPLRDRPEDIEPNLLYELEQFALRENTMVTFNKEARERFLDFAKSPEALWTGNFRDLNGSINRMATLATGGRITAEDVAAEIKHLRAAWKHASAAQDREGSVGGGSGVGGRALLEKFLPASRLRELDRFQSVQLADALRACVESPTLSDAGRLLFAASRRHRKTSNDADRLRKYFRTFNLEWFDFHDE